MEGERIKEKFVKKIYRELQELRISLPIQEGSDICGESYKFEIFSALYEILLEKADSISDTILAKLLAQSTGILETFYQDWLKKEDSFYQELSEHVENEFTEQQFGWNEEG